MSTLTVYSVPASGPGALDGFEFSCPRCGERAGYSLRTMAEAEARRHEEWCREHKGGGDPAPQPATYEGPEGCRYTIPEDDRDPQPLSLHDQLQVKADRIGLKLQAIRDRVNDYPYTGHDFGFLGDLGHVEDELDELLGFLGVFLQETK